MQILNKLEYRIYELSFKLKLSHIESSITALPIIFDIYTKQNKDDKFILSSGHCGLALYVVLEHFYKISAEDLYHKHGTHPNRDEENYIYCSSGSLGCGLPIAVGMALSNLNSKINCLISDGELAEGSIWESLRFAHNNKLTNLFVHLNYNGYSALDKVDKNYTKKLCKNLYKNIKVHVAKKTKFKFLNALEGHYHVLTEDQFKEIKKYYEKRIC